MPISPVVPVLLGEDKTQEQFEKAVMEIIVKPFDPGQYQSRRDSNQSTSVSEFAENLAYDVQKEFGDSFKTWLGEDRNRNTGTECKVKHDLSSAPEISNPIHPPTYSTTALTNN